MILPDSIRLLTDSTKILSDSLAKSDSIATADSLHLVDSIRTAEWLNRGFVGIPHPSIPQTENWVFVILFLLFFLLVYSIYQSSGFITDTIKTFFQVKERSSIFSKATVNDERFRFFLNLFSVCVLSFYVYFLLHKPELPFSFREFGLILIVSGLFIVFKLLIFELIGYVFFNRVSIKMARDSYFNVISFCGVALFPILFLQIYLPDNLAGITNLLSLFVCISAAILIIIKLFQIFFRKILASFYILLYLCTLEILPLIILFKVYKLIL